MTTEPAIAVTWKPAKVKIRGAGGAMDRLLPDFLNTSAAKRLPRLPSHFSTDGQPM
jgi:hypothetical protein